MPEKVRCGRVPTHKQVVTRRIVPDSVTGSQGHDIHLDCGKSFSSRGLVFNSELGWSRGFEDMVEAFGLQAQH